VLARQHDERVKGRSVPCADAKRPMWHALEVRHTKVFATPPLSISCAVTGLRSFVPTRSPAPTDGSDLRLRLLPSARFNGAIPVTLRKSGSGWAARIEAWARDAPMLDGEFAGCIDAAPAPSRNVFLFLTKPTSSTPRMMRRR
jgi:hypothetical protein